MLFPNINAGSCRDSLRQMKALDAYRSWHPDREEVLAASDYALDGMARSTGHDPMDGDGRAYWHDEWLRKHRRGKA